MKSEQRQWIDARDKPSLLLAMMKEFSNNSHISFEGSLENLSFFNINGASTNETETLKRQTISPKLDFVVLPLTDETIQEIWQELEKKDHLVNEGIIHVQIEHKEKLAFGGYDNFHKECVIAYSSVPLELLEYLKEKGIIRGFKQGNA